MVGRYGLFKAFSFALIAFLFVGVLGFQKECKEFQLGIEESRIGEGLFRTFQCFSGRVKNYLIWDDQDWGERKELRQKTCFHHQKEKITSTGNDYSGSFHLGLSGKEGHENFKDDDEIEKIFQQSCLVSQNLLLTSRMENSGSEGVSVFGKFLPKFFVNAEEIFTSNVSGNIETVEMKNEYFLVVFCIIELFFSLSHILVHLGIKNPRYRFIIKQRIYFAFDGSCSIINLWYFWDYYYLMKALLLYVILAHAYYVADLFLSAGKSRIFKWSSIDNSKNRFNQIYLKENIETLFDDLCHFSGFLISFIHLPLSLQFFSVLSSLSILWILVLNAKFFYTKRHMMPTWLHPLLKEDPR
jgi:hypothetical protein